MLNEFLTKLGNLMENALLQFVATATTLHCFIFFFWELNEVELNLIE